MQLGIPLSVRKFKEEANVLRGLLDFVDVFLVGDEGVSSLFGCGFELT